jgi:hypothetical protein
MKARLGGKWFQLRRSGNLGNCGECDTTKHKNGKVDRIIRVATWQAEEDELDTWVHEAMHAIWPAMTEQEVAKSSAELSKMLWRLGYRRIQHGKIME